MADYLTTDTELTSVADAIREKGGTSAALVWPSGYVDAIGAIESGGGPSVNPAIPQYGFSSSAMVYIDYEYARVSFAATAGDTVRIKTYNHFYLNSLRRDDTGADVPYTTVSTSSSGGEYTFTMPDASVTYSLHYDD